MNVKLTVLLAGFLSAGALCKASDVVENFDWGTDISGRTSVTKGLALDGQTVQTGGAVWDTTQRSRSANTEVVFSGTEGAGNGTVAPSGTNAAVKFNYRPVAGWCSGVVTATAEGAITWGTGTQKFLYMGFQAAKYSGSFMSSQTSDKILVQLSSTGLIAFNAIIGGTTNVGTKTSLACKSGDTVTFKMSIDVVNKIATVVTTVEKNSSTNTVTLSGGTNPKWSTFCIQETGNSTLALDFVSIDTTSGTPIILGMRQMNSQPVMPLLEKYSHAG